MLDGTRLAFRGGRMMVLPPLDVYTARKHTKNGGLKLVVDFMRQGAQGLMLPSDEQWDAIVALIKDALSANYPELAADDDGVAKLLDFSNLADVLKALFVSSGYKETGSGEAQGRSNGTTSSPTSSPSPAGPSSGSSASASPT